MRCSFPPKAHAACTANTKTGLRPNLRSRWQRQHPSGRQTGIQPTEAPSVGGDDRVTILELDLVDVPGTTRSAAAQRINLKLEFVTGLQSLAGPSVTDKTARRAAFKAPNLAGAVLLLDFQDDEGVRGGVLPIFHNTDEIDWMFLIEHGEGMMRQRNAAHRNKRCTYQNCFHMGFHLFPPLIFNR